MSESITSHRSIPGSITSPGSLTDIITGRFEQQSDAQEALADLFEAGYSKDQLSLFFVESDAGVDPALGGAEPMPLDHASKGVSTGAAVGGVIGTIAAVAAIAAAPALAPAAVAVAGAGAYAGSLAGAMAEVEDQHRADAEAPRGESSKASTTRATGTLIAASAPTQEQQRRVVEILRARGAKDIQRTEGSIVDGRWTDYDPRAPLQLIE